MTSEMQKMKIRKCTQVTRFSLLASIITPIGTTLGQAYYESFNYDTGDLTDASSWTENVALNNDQVVSPGLSFGGLAVAGNKASLSIPSNANQRFFDDIGTAFGNAGEIVYLSFLMRDGDDTDEGGFAGIQLYSNGSGGTEEFFIGRTGGGAGGEFYALLDDGAYRDLSSVAFSEDVVFGVVKIEFEAGVTSGNERVSLYLNADPTGAEPSIVDSILDDVDDFTFDTLALDSNKLFDVDEIRIGSTWNSVTTVIPEQETYALFGGVLALVAIGVRRLKAVNR